MSQHKIAALIGLGVPPRTPYLRAVLHDRLQVIRHRVAISRIIIPGLESHPLAELISSKLLSEANAGVETAVVANLKDEPGLSPVAAKLLTLLDARSERFFDEHVLTGGDCAARERDMIGIGRRDDHGLETWIREHAVVVAI